MHQLQEWSSGHAHAFALIQLLHVRADGVDSCAAIGMDVKIEAERKHGQHTSDGLQLSRVDALRADNVGSNKCRPGDVMSSQQAFICWKTRKWSSSQASPTATDQADLAITAEYEPSV